MPDQRAVVDWIARYERAWRAPGTVALAGIFTEDVTYVPSPWAKPIVGLPAVRRFWETARGGPDEAFRMTSAIVAIDGRTAVMRVAVDYDDGQRWRDVWLLTFDDDGRCQHFEEWPFAPDQHDGHEQERS